LEGEIGIRPEQRKKEALDELSKLLKMIILRDSTTSVAQARSDAGSLDAAFLI
jgi:hypothetical protein